MIHESLLRWISSSTCDLHRWSLPHSSFILFCLDKIRLLSPSELTHIKDPECSWCPSLPKLTCPASGEIKRKRSWENCSWFCSFWLKKWVKANHGLLCRTCWCPSMSLQWTGVTCPILELPQGQSTILWWGRSKLCLGSILELNLLCLCRTLFASRHVHWVWCWQ